MIKSMQLKSEPNAEITVNRGMTVLDLHLYAERDVADLWRECAASVVVALLLILSGVLIQDIFQFSGRWLL